MQPTRPEPSGDWRPAQPLCRLAGALLAHAVLLWCWYLALHQTRVELAQPSGTAGLLWLLPLPPAPLSPRPAAASPTAVQATLRARTRRITVSAEPVPSKAVASPATSALPLPSTPPKPQDRPVGNATVPLMQTEATRRALRDFARQPLLSERAASATDITPVTDAQRFAGHLGGSLKGDCGKGAFAGSGMGLLSVPLLVLAKVGDQCAQ